jgi:hypothetical protein
MRRSHDRDVRQKAFGIHIGKVVYGDLTGDGQEEAALERWEKTGGTGNFPYIDIISLDHGRPKIFATIGGDADRCVNGIAYIEIIGGSLFVCRWSPDTSPPNCVRPHMQEWRWSAEPHRMALWSDRPAKCEKRIAPASQRYHDVAEVLPQIRSAHGTASPFAIAT